MGLELPSDFVGIDDAREHKQNVKGFRLCHHPFGKHILYISQKGAALLPQNFLSDEHGHISIRCWSNSLERLEVAPSYQTHQ